jgi:hypothetical protein
MPSVIPEEMPRKKCHVARDDLVECFLPATTFHVEMSRQSPSMSEDSEVHFSFSCIMKFAAMLGP